MTTVVISQPFYFPWPGFYELASTADIYIHLDDVLFSRGGVTNRIQLKTATGPAWMTIPLVGRGSFQPIFALEARDATWRGTHRALLGRLLAGAPHLARVLEIFDGATSGDRLSDIFMAGTDAIADELGLNSGIVRLRASSLNVPGQSWRRVLDLVRHVGGTRYVTAHGAARYLDHEAFEREGVEVDYIDYSLNPWPQFHEPFTPYVSGLDLLAHCGPSAREHLRPRTVPWRVMVQRLSA